MAWATANDNYKWETSNDDTQMMGIERLTSTSYLRIALTLRTIFKDRMHRESSLKHTLQGPRIPVDMAVPHVQSMSLFFIAVPRYL